jgi:hypothetical protein
MIARSALPFSARNLFDRIRQPVSGARLRGSRLSRWQRMFAAYGDWSSVLDLASRGEARSDDRTEQSRRYCRDCERETSHEEFDEFGLGWYALICRCRRCGRESMSVWPLASW